MEFLKQRKEIVAAGHRLVDDKLVSRSWGNISIKVSNKQMLITPSGRTYEHLHAGEIILMNLARNKTWSTLQPSSEYPLHIAVYRQRAEINAVIHTHQPYATVLAVAHIELPAVTDDMAQIIGSSVKVAAYAKSGSMHFANYALRALGERNAALLANHGALCVGRSLDEAFVVAEILEKSAMAYLAARLLGSAYSIDKLTAENLHRIYLQKYSRLEKDNK